MRAQTPQVEAPADVVTGLKGSITRPILLFILCYRISSSVKCQTNRESIGLFLTERGVDVFLGVGTTTGLDKNCS